MELGMNDLLSGLQSQGSGSGKFSGQSRTI